MILKFDHIALSCKREELEGKLQTFQGYKQIFYEKKKTNLQIKKLLMKRKMKDHDIILLNCDGKPPIEITAYDDTFSSTNLMLKDNLIEIYTCDIDATRGFYEAMGFILEKDILVLKPILDNMPVNLSLCYIDDFRKGFLDSSGYCCLAFLSNNAEKECKRLNDKGIDTTDIEELTVNGVTLKIFFSYNNIGNICEFIQPK